MAQENNNQNKNQQQDINQLLKVRREKLAALQEAGKDPFQITKFDVTHHSQEVKDNFDALEGTRVTIAGRMMFKRVMGKASFCNIQDLKGDIQCYVARDSIGEDPMQILRNTMWEIFLALAARFSGRKQVRSPFMQLLSHCCQRVFKFCLKSITG